MKVLHWAFVVLSIAVCLSHARRRRARKKAEVCSSDEICKKIEAAQESLKAQTEAMATQGKMIAGRLDAAEAKVEDIGNIGKKLTDLMAQQGTKIQEQGSKLGAEEAKLGDLLKAQMTSMEAKMSANTARITALTDKTAALTTRIGESDTKITSLQTEGVKILDKLGGTTKKMEAKITQQSAKLGSLLPLPDGKFTEISKGHSMCVDKMEDFKTKFDSMKGNIEALKEKVGAAESKLSAVEDSTKGLGGKLDAVAADIEAQEALTGAIAAKVGETDTKIGEIATQGSAVADTVAAQAVKVGAVAAAKLKMKEKLNKQMEAAAGIKEKALAVAGQMKEHESKLAKVQAELDKPPPPPPPAAPAPPAAGKRFVPPVYGKK